VALTPEIRSPSPVDLLQRAVFRTHPSLKSRPAKVAIATGRRPQRKFVIDLPSDHRGMGGKLSRHLGCNRKRETPVGLVGGTGEAPTSRAQLFAFLVYLDHVWILHRQPRRRRRGRSSENHGDVIPMKNVYRALQPGEIEP